MSSLTACVLFASIVVAEVYAGCSDCPKEACKSPCPHPTVQYGDDTVNCGALIPKEKAKLEPKVTGNVAEKNANYILLMVDPDAPGSGKDEGWAHWIVEYTSEELEKGEKGKVFLEYNPPTPPSGTHHYGFFLIHETKKAPIEKVSSRAKFNYEDFIKKHGSVVATFMYRTSA